MEPLVRVLRRHRRRVGKQGDAFLKLFISKRLIHGAATAILGIFVPIFLYETTGHHFYVVGLYYALLSLLYVLFLVPGMFIMNRVGFSRSLVVGGVLSVILYSMMYFLDANNIWYILPPLALVITGFRIFHWIPYHVDFTKFTKDGERGRQVSLSFATIAFMGVIGPILAGFIISNAGYDALFATAVALLVAATVSYSFVPETRTKYTWTVKQAWRKLFAKDTRGLAVGEFANGMEVVVNILVWPIFLYEILDGDVFEIGAVSTIVVGATIVVQLLLGKHLDKGAEHKHKTLKIGSSLYAVGWILKIFVLSAAQVFFVGLYHNIVKIFTKTPFQALLYDMSADQGRYIDEYTVLREMAGHSGRVIGLVLVSALSLFIPIGWTFVIAAGASIALNFVYRLEVRD